MVYLLVLLLLGGVSLLVHMWINHYGRGTQIAVTVLVVLGLTAATYTMLGTASMKRTLRSIDSEFNENIEREITVHSRSGEILHQSRGRFDVNYSDGRIKWIDESNKVHIIYLGDSATVTVNEL